MKKALFATVLLIMAGSTPYVNAKPSFQQASDHCYFLNIEVNGENIAVVSTGQGTLLFDPPPEPDLSVLLENLRNLTGGPVRWMVNTGYYPSQMAGVDYFARQGAILLAGFRQRELDAPEPEYPDEPSKPLDSPDAAPGFSEYTDPSIVSIMFPNQDEDGMENPEIPEEETSALPEFIFKNRMYLFPDDVEIEIHALPQEARTGADIFAYVPDEKVLFVGRLFEPGYYPDIDTSTGGSALKWIDALEQVIDSVPLLISAIPPEEPEDEEGVEEGGAEGVEEEEEKTPEEMITVIPARGEVANLQAMKDMLDISKKLRNGISRTVKAGRSCERYLDSAAAGSYRIYGNYYPYAEQLCRELAPAKTKEPEASSQ
jgi:glyoxylase-like metal-dependent hydrolase (beta-lactamase superfamily II)